MLLVVVHRKKSRSSRAVDDEEEEVEEKEVVSLKRSKYEETQAFAELSGVLEVIINAKRVPGAFYAYMDRVEFWCDGHNKASVVVRHDEIKSMDFFEKLTDEGRVGPGEKQKAGTKYKFELCIKVTLKV